MRDAIEMIIEWLVPPVMHTEPVKEEAEPGNYFGS